MKVFLVQAPQWGLQPPIGLAQLGAYLLREGHDVTAFDVNIDLYLRRTEGQTYAWTDQQSFAWRDPELVKDALGRHRAFIGSEYIAPIERAGRCVVGFSINFFSLEASLQIAAMVKEANPAAAVVFGGEFFTVEPDWKEWVFPRGVVDAVVIGDGEETLAEFIQLWKDKKDLARCAGLCYAVPGGFRETPKRPYIELDTTPFADFSLFRGDSYPADPGIYAPGDLLMMTSRGCVRHCMFCAYRVAWPGFRTMSGDRIFAEIKHQRKLHGPIGHIKFYDLLMNGNMRVLNRLVELILADDEPPVPWHHNYCIVRPEMNEEVMRRMKAAGCRIITYGIESGSQTVLDLMRKQQTVAEAERVLAATKAAGIRTQIDIMTGYPGETAEEHQRTIDFVLRNKRHIDSIYPSFTFTLLGSNAPLDSPEVKKKNEISDDHPMFWQTADGSNTYPERMRRYKKFCAEAAAAGLTIENGLNVEYYMTMSLADYYHYKKDWAQAAELYQKCLETDPRNELILKRLEECRRVPA